MRRSIPTETQTEVLLKTKRRCCLCFGLNIDFAQKSGQIAHLDKNPNNNSPSNLAFLCLDHHDKYDSSTSQSKGFTKKEVLTYQEQLIRHIESQIVKSLQPLERPCYSKKELEEALKFHMGTHRSQSLVLELEKGPKTLDEITMSIPPYDREWIETILNGVVYSGWVRQSLSDFDYFELTLNGRRMLEVLKILPDSLKESAWKEVWTPE